MASVLGFLALAAIAVAQTRLDRRVWGTAATPGVLLVGGYAVIGGVYALARLSYDLVEVGALTYVVITFAGLLCMGASMLAAAVLRWQPSEILVSPEDDGVLPRGLLLALVATYVPIAVGRGLLSDGGLWSTDARDALGHGFAGHMHAALAFATVWYAVLGRDRRRIRNPLLAAALLALSLYPVKGWTLIPLTAVVLASFLRSGERSRAGRHLLVLGASGILIFFGIYVSRGEWGPSDPEQVLEGMSPIFQHFLFYLTSGFVGLNAVVHGLQLQGGFSVIFAPFVNLLSAVTGDRYVTIISESWVEVTATDHSNVFSFIGSLIGYTSPPAGLLLAALMITAGYLLFGAVWRSRAGALRAAVLYFNAVFAFGWFEYYFWHLDPFEVLVVAFFFAVLSSRLRAPAPHPVAPPETPVG